ncbi:hypothetical protein QW131_01165 [Roseibium salinum]|nr:hypothetical protein [Roseibium salinum]
MQHAFQDQIFDLLHHGGSRFLMIDGLKHADGFLCLRGKIAANSQLVNLFVQYLVAQMPRPGDQSSPGRESDGFLRVLRAS